MDELKTVNDLDATKNPIHLSVNQIKTRTFETFTTLRH